MGLTVEPRPSPQPPSTPPQPSVGPMRSAAIEEGKRADLVVLDAPNYHHLVYHYGVNPVRHVVKGGRVVVKDGVRSG